MPNVTSKECLQRTDKVMKSMKDDLKEQSDRHHAALNKVTIQLFKNHEKMEKILDEVSKVKVATQGQEERIKVLETQHDENRQDHQLIFKKLDAFILSVNDKFAAKKDLEKIDKDYVDKEKFNRVENLIDRLMILVITSCVGLVVTIIVSIITHIMSN